MIKRSILAFSLSLSLFSGVAHSSNPFENLSTTQTVLLVGTGSILAPLTWMRVRHGIPFLDGILVIGGFLAKPSFSDMKKVFSS